MQTPGITIEILIKPWPTHVDFLRFYTVSDFSFFCIVFLISCHRCCHFRLRQAGSIFQYRPVFDPLYLLDCSLPAQNTSPLLPYRTAAQMGQIPLVIRCFHQTSMSSFLKFMGWEIPAGQHRRIGSHLIRTIYIPASCYSHCMVIASTTFRSHQIIVTVFPIQMWSFCNAQMRPLKNHLFRPN